MTKRNYHSDALRAAHATVKDLHDIGVVDDATMRRFELPGIQEHQEIQKQAMARRVKPRSAKRQKIVKAMERAAEKVRKEGPSDGRFRPAKREA